MNRLPHLIRRQRMTIVSGILIFVITIVVLQLYLLTASVNAYLGGDRSIVLPAVGASVLCFALNAGLLLYLYRLE
jgi:hypothetical protein